MNNPELDFSTDHLLTTDIRKLTSAFLLDRKSQGLSPKTIRAYSFELKYFLKWLETNRIITLSQLTAGVIRAYLIDLANHRNAGGCHIAYRVIKTFTLWWERETDGDYRSPVRKVKAPKLHILPIQGITPEDVGRLLSTFGNDFYGLRNRALLLALLDTGCRAQELLDINLEDIQIDTGDIIIRNGKGGKYRHVYVGVKTRRAIRRYLKLRSDRCPALWISDDAIRMTYDGMRDIVRRAAERTGIPEPGLHSFRRAFALGMLRAGTDIITLKRLMGHADLTVLERYLAQNSADLMEAHRKASPADNWKI